MGEIRIPKSSFDSFNPRVYFCKRASRPFVLDGDIDKDFWADADFTSDFVDIQGESFEKPRFRTRAKMLWDDKNLYIAAELMGDEIWGYVKDHDDVIYYDNDFEVFIDPDSDTQQYYEFEMNVLNTVWDLLLTKAYRDNGVPMNSLDIKGLKTAVKVDGEINNPAAKSKRWCCEIVMPFETLIEGNNRGHMPSYGDFFRMNFSRVQWKVDVIDNKFVKKTDEKTGKPLPEDNWVWMPTGIINMHYPELWSFVFFCKDNEVYQVPENEYLKWELRRYYYAQHAYFDENGCFTADASKLKVSSEIVPDIQITSRLFEMSCPAVDGGKRVVILSDGKVFVEA